MADDERSTPTVELEIAKIVHDPDLQQRVAMDGGTVFQFAEAMQDGSVFPPVTVFLIGDRHVLVDGHHRVDAALECGRETILAVVREGTREEAMWAASAANVAHDMVGLRRSNEDKRHAVSMALSVRPELSDREIAKHVGVSHSFVGLVRNPSVNGLQMVREVTRGGTIYTMDISGIGRRVGEGEGDAGPDRTEALPPEVEVAGEDEEGAGAATIRMRRSAAGAAPPDDGGAWEPRPRLADPRREPLDRRVEPSPQEECHELWMRARHVLDLFALKVNVIGGLGTATLGWGEEERRSLRACVEAFRDEFTEWLAGWDGGEL